MNRRVIEAALDLLISGNSLSTLTLVDLAERTGISRNAIYRRWKTKDELCAEVVQWMQWKVPEISEQSARDNLVTLLDAYCGRVADPRVRQIERALSAEARSFPVLHKYYLDEVVAPWTNAITSAIRRGKETGEIRVNVDEQLLVEMLVGPVFARLHGAGFEDGATTSWSQFIADLAFDGASPQS